MSVLLACFSSAAHAEVVLDGTLGQKGAVSGPNYVITDKMGSQAGSNLFHSFQTFNINTGESGTFTGPNSVQNVIGRVTGGTSSLIDGRLGCSIPGANLFLINPYGMMFGPNATLDVNGSFHASTADYLLLGDAGRFDAVHPEQSVLTVDPPSAFGFLDDTAAPIKVDGSYLKVPEGETLSLVGGDITLSDATLYAPGGEIDLVSVASAGEVTFGASGPGVDSFERLGDINITRSDAEHVKIDDTEIGDVDVSGEGGGVVYVRGGNFYLDGGRVLANTMGDEDSRGGIDVRVRDTVAFENGTRVYSTTTGKGDAGDILLEASDLSLLTGAQVSTNAWEGSTGKGGSITVNADGKVAIGGKSSAGYSSGLFSNTYGEGDGGNITVTASSLSLEEGGVIEASTIGQGRGGTINVKADEIHATGGYIFARTYGAGDAGDILLEGYNMAFKDGAQVGANAWEGSTGKGGNITVNADGKVAIGGTSSDGYPSGLFSDTDGEGDGGSITVTASSLSLEEGGVIEASTIGQGRGGTINVKADEIHATGGYIFAHTYGAGDAGDILLEGYNMAFKDGAQVGASAREGSTGKGGNITVNADGKVAIGGKNSAGYSSGLYSNTYGEGDGGNITVTASSLSLEEGGVIEASTIGQGRGGTINVKADEIHATGGYIFASTYGAGDAGDISLEGNNMSFKDGAQVGASAREGSTGKGGSITINADGKVAIGGKSSAGYSSGLFSNTYGEGDGGSVTVTASSFSLEEGGQIRAITTGQGRGGTINVEVNELLATGGHVYAHTYGTGDAGNILLEGNNMTFKDGAQVGVGALEGSTGEGGNITIKADGKVAIGGTDSAGYPSGLFSSTYAEGDGGNITISAASLSLEEGGGISADTTGQGRGGTITVKADEIHVTGGDIFPSPLARVMPGIFRLRGTICRSRMARRWGPVPGKARPGKAAVSPSTPMERWQSAEKAVPDIPADFSAIPMAKGMGEASTSPLPASPLKRAGGFRRTQPDRAGAGPSPSRQMKYTSRVGTSLPIPLARVMPGIFCLRGTICRSRMARRWGPVPGKARPGKAAVSPSTPQGPLPSQGKTAKVLRAGFSLAPMVLVKVGIFR